MNSNSFEKSSRVTLVTTACKETWPTDGVLVFLGEWCKEYGTVSDSILQSSKTLHYHWNDEKKFISDYRSLRLTYSKMLRVVSAALNHFHGVKHDVDYWRILIGPWLGTFLQIIFDRTEMLKVALNEGGANSIIIRKVSEPDYTPNDFEEFTAFFLTDEWNEFLYTKILQIIPHSLAVEEINFSTERSIGKKKQIAKKEGSQPKNVFNVIKNGFFLFLNFLDYFCKFPTHFMIGSYLSSEDEIELQIKLRQVPRFWGKESVPTYRVNECSRKQLYQEIRKNLVNPNQFENIAINLVAMNIPLSYLEGYTDLSSKTRNFYKWPRNPKTIFTSNNFWWDDFFKLWCAEMKSRKNVPLIIGQHGGTFGIAQFIFSEEHQLEICDKYLSWGWQKRGSNEKIVPLGIIKRISTRENFDSKPDGTVLVVQNAIPRYSYSIGSSGLAAKQWIDYFGSQVRFIDCLVSSIQQKVLVRLFKRDMGLRQKERWVDRFPALKVDDGSSDIRALKRECRICVSTYNATTFLETLAENIPTLVFWEPCYGRLRGDAMSCFKTLRAAGIFYDSPEHAARQLNLIWDDIEGWWFSESVQSARLVAIKNFAKINEKKISDLSNLFSLLSCSDEKSG